MATTESREEAAATTTEQGVSLLDQALAATRQTDHVQVKDLLKTLAREALDGTVTYSKNLTQTLQKAIADLDETLSRQLSAITHAPKFLKLEGSWRGLHYLVRTTETGTQQEIRVLSVTKKELHKDLTRNGDFEQSQVFKKVYEGEFGIAGGKPYGALIGDYEFENTSDDMEILNQMSAVSATAFAPFISAASPSLFGFSDFTELTQPRDIEKVFGSSEYAEWRAFRAQDSSRFVTLTMPRILARPPHESRQRAADEFEFTEADSAGGVEPFTKGTQRRHLPSQMCWTNAAYGLGTCLTTAFLESGFCVAIRGAEGGGKVENLPTYNFVSDDGDQDSQCPTEIGITDRREAELSRAGFLPLCHYRNTNYAVFFGAQTTQKPKVFDEPEATANAAISARLPYIMATSRIAHYLKVMARDNVGKFKDAAELEKELNRWINRYVNASAGASQESRAKYPLREAKVEVRDIPGNPGSYNAVAYLRPWLQMEELTASMRLVAEIPKAK